VCASNPAQQVYSANIANGYVGIEIVNWHRESEMLSCLGYYRTVDFMNKNRRAGLSSSLLGEAKNALLRRGAYTQVTPGSPVFIKKKASSNLGLGAFF